MPIDDPDLPAAREILTPSGLNRLARDLLEDALPLVWIEGELSNCSRPASGHLYFTLKDSSAQIRCAMFKPRSTWLKFRPTEGLHVLARARVSLYEARGEFQLIVEHLEEAGEGALQREFARLKAQLAAEGLFDAAHKRPLPTLARRIGVITSPSGAAVHDVLSVIARRFPLAEVEILPVPVQGREAPPAIVAMLAAASAAARHDVLLLTRGGGSLEDLWAFNEETVARAIRASTIPVVVAVGHEIDFTIADFAADLRAPTPSAAAELLVPDGAAVLRRLAELRRCIVTVWRRRHDALRQRLDYLHARLLSHQPGQRLARGRERLASLRRRLALASSHRLAHARARLDRIRAALLAHRPERRLAQLRERADALALRLLGTTRRGLDERRRRLSELGRALNALGPLATLDRGYAILFDPADGSIVRSVSQVAPGTRLRARLADGSVFLEVERIDPDTVPDDPR